MSRHDEAANALRARELERRHAFFLLLSSLALLLSLTPHCAPAAPEPIASAASPILGGTVDGTQRAVMAIVWSHPDGTMEIGSGSLVASDLVLTAQHCVSPSVVQGSVDRVTLCGELEGDASPILPDLFGAPAAASQFKVYPQTQTPRSSAGALEVVEVLVPPNTTGASMCGNDIALLRLASPLDGVTPLPLRLSKPPVPGEPLTVVGYGANGTDRTAIGTRHTRSGVTVESVGATMLGSWLLTTETEWIVSEGPCGGDSGGPAIDKDGRIVGVMSRGPSTECKSMIYERVDSFAPWLRGYVGENPPPIAVDAGSAPDVSGGPASSVSSSVSSNDPGTTTVTRNGCQTTSARPRPGAPFLAVVAALVFALRWGRAGAVRMVSRTTRRSRR